MRCRAGQRFNGVVDVSVIAWDGRTLAADKQATSNGVRFTTTKIRRLPSGDVLAWTGDEDHAHMVAKWYEDGADPGKWSKVQKEP